MKNIFLLLIIFVLGYASLSYSYSFFLSDSLINNKVISADWVIRWNDEYTIAVNSITNTIDTVFYDYYENEDEIKYGYKYDIIEDDWFYDMDYTLLSIVGPYISFLVSYSGSGGVHPIAGNFYSNYNLISKSTIKITDIFPSDEVFSELLKDSLIFTNLKGYKPKDIPDLILHLEGECDIDFSSLLENFAIKEISTNEVVVEFGLGHGCEVMKGNITFFNVKLEIPENKKTMFDEAKQNQTYINKLVAKNFYENLKWY